MDKNNQYIILASGAFIASFLFFAIYNNWIIFRGPFNHYDGTIVSNIIQKKQITHYYFHGDKWKMEKQEVLWQDKAERNIYHLVNAWLTLLDEEHITMKKTTLQSVLVSTSGIAYLSFDHNILGKEETIFKKWMLIEGLLKTITSSDISITHIQFLVQHQPLQDIHIDFSLPWPVQGFIGT